MSVFDLSTLIYDPAGVGNSPVPADSGGSFNALATVEGDVGWNSYTPITAEPIDYLGDMGYWFDGPAYQPVTGVDPLSGLAAGPASQESGFWDTLTGIGKGLLNAIGGGGSLPTSSTNVVQQPGQTGTPVVVQTGGGIDTGKLLTMAGIGLVGFLFLRGRR